MSSSAPYCQTCAAPPYSLCLLTDETFSSKHHELYIKYNNRFFHRSSDRQTTQARFGLFTDLWPSSEMQVCCDKDWNVTERVCKMVSMSMISTWGLAVEDLRSKKAASCLLCNVGVVQLTEATDCRQEKVPQAHIPGFHLHTQIGL